MARLWPRRRSARTTEERVETAPPPRPRPFWPWLVLLLALVLGALAASWYFANRDETVDAERVPDVVGVRQEEAERRLDERGFEQEVRRVESTRPPGTVTAQRPVPGTLYGEGGIVVISVSRSPNTVEVPDVTGLPTAQAQTRLRAAGLQSRVETIRSPRPRGRVLRQVPAAGGEVERGTPVVVIVSAGQEIVDVPDVVGLNAGAATAQLAQAGFRAQIREVAGAEPAGTVVAQNPGGGARAPRGQIVRLNVTRGRTQTATTVLTTTTPARAAVPDTVGQDEGTAVSTLQGAGFQPQVINRAVTDPADDGFVIRQSPPGGTAAAPGSTVTITVGRLR